MNLIANFENKIANMADNFLELLEKKWEKTRSGKKEIEKLKERIKELENKPATTDEGTQTDLSKKNIPLLLEQWEQVAQWAQEEGIDVNQNWGLKTLKNKILTKFKAAKNNAAETQKKQEAQITKLSEELKKLPEKDEAIKSLEKKNEDLKSNLEVNKKLLEEQINKVKQLEQGKGSNISVEKIIEEVWELEDIEELFESDEKSKLKKEINERLLSEKTEKDKIFLIFFNYLRTYSNALEINKLEEISSQASQAREKYIVDLEKQIEELKAELEEQKKKKKQFRKV